MAMRSMLQRGALSGLFLALILAIWDGVTAHGQLFALRAGLIGVMTGGIALVLALSMSLVGYHLAAKNRLPEVRLHLVLGAVFTGTAGMVLGMTSATLWLLAGRPWFH
jgi:hypothetical protein